MIKIDENQDKDVTYENEPDSQRQLFPNIPLTVDVSPLQDAIDALDDRMDDAESDIDSIMTTLQTFDGQPGVAETVSDMTDTNKIYIYVGSETGYTSGDWYYYDGTAWVSGGEYAANPVQIDDTLTQSGEAADAKVTGDEIAQIKSDFDALMISKGVLLNSSSKFVSPYNSFDTFPVGECVLITTNPQSYASNYPANFTAGWILTFNYKNVTTGGVAQIALYATAAQNGKIAWRIKWGDTWRQWYYFENSVDVKTGLTTLINAVSTDANSKLVVRGYNEVTNSSHQNITDANNAEINRVYSIQSANVVSNLPSESIQGTLITLNYKDTAAGKIQLFHASSGVLYSRIYWTSWRDWVKYATESYVYGVLSTLDAYPNLYAAFETLGVIGDSLASGECYDSENHGTDIYSVSWLQFMCRAVGMTGYNFSKGGLTSKTWLTDAMGYTLASDPTKKCKGYIIGLGQNDANVGMTIGTISDINDSDYTLNADSYYGNYGGIIQRMKVIQPDAKFFLLTDPLGANSTTRANYNTAVRAIAQHFTNCYLVDLEDDAEIFLDSDSYIQANNVNNHYTAAAYKYIAGIISQRINKIMFDNPADFKFVQFIGAE